LGSEISLKPFSLSDIGNMSIFNDLYSFNASMTIPEIDKLRTRLMLNISDMNVLKAKMTSSDFTQLMNYHQYCLNIFNTMINTRKVMEADTYALNQGPYTNDVCIDNPVRGRKTLIYTPDGSSKIIGENELCRKNEEWEQQFTPSTMQSPPHYSFPPSNVWNIASINYRS
jgi:hypothetical protein